MKGIRVQVGCDENGMGGKQYLPTSHQDVGTLSLQWGWHYGHCGRVMVIWRNTAYSLHSYLLCTGQGAILGDHFADLADEASAERRSLST
jgi:hypothetical protein